MSEPQAPLSTEKIIRVSVVHESILYVCQCVYEAGGWVCGKCHKGALGPYSKVGDLCDQCGVRVAQVSKGSPEPVPEWLGQLLDGAYP